MFVSVPAPLRLAALLALATVVSSVKITEFAVPSAIPAGESAELQCRYSLEAGETEQDVVLKWWWRAVNADAPVPLYQRIGNNAPSAAHRNIEVAGNDSLVLTALQPSDSGEYECEVACDLAEARRKQHLSVYTQGTGPHVNITASDDASESSVVTCEASDAAPKPELVITVDGAIVNATTEVWEVEGGKYGISARAQLPEEAGEGTGTEVRCELFYEDEGISHPAYVDFITMEVTGDAAETTTLAAEEEVTEAQELLQADTDGATSLFSPALLLTATTLLLCL